MTLNVFKNNDTNKINNDTNGITVVNNNDTNNNVTNNYKCGLNEIWKYGNGSGCLQTCKNPLCLNKNLNSDCACLQGYVRNKKNECVSFNEECEQAR